MKEIVKLLVLSILIGVAGCQSDKEDLQLYVEKVGAQQKSDIPPIPVMKPYKKFDYAAMDLKDPFIPTVVDTPEPASLQESNNGIAPDENRRKEALESYELSELQYVGSIEQDTVWALIRANDGVIHRVQTGNYMGRNNGKIQSISQTSLVLEEIVPNGRSGYIKKETTLSAVEVK